MLLRLPIDPGAYDDDPAFRAKWGRENCILWGRARHADFGPCTHTLSIRAAWGGVEHCRLDGRVLGVDDDNFLIVNHGRIYSSSICSHQPVESLVICFSQMHLEGHGNQFLEHLRPHDNAVSPVLQSIRHALAQGCEDESWLDAQLTLLLQRMRAHQEQMLDRVDRLGLMRAATRLEVFCRVSRATDLLHSSYASGVDLTELAETASLSKYHFLRLFKLVNGMTPHTYLQRKRVTAAVRLLESTTLTVRDVAVCVGFADDSTLVRQMRRWTRHTPGQVRAGALGTAVGLAPVGQASPVSEASA